MSIRVSTLGNTEYGYATRPSLKKNYASRRASVSSLVGFKNVMMPVPPVPLPPACPPSPFSFPFPWIADCIAWAALSISAPLAAPPRAAARCCAMMYRATIPMCAVRKVASASTTALNAAFSPFAASPSPCFAQKAAIDGRASMSARNARWSAGM